MDYHMAKSCSTERRNCDDVLRSENSFDGDAFDDPSRVHPKPDKANNFSPNTEDPNFENFNQKKNKVLQMI